MIRLVLLIALAVACSAAPRWSHSVVVSGPSGRIATRHSSSSHSHLSHHSAGYPGHFAPVHQPIYSEPIKPVYPDHSGVKGGYIGGKKPFGAKKSPMANIAQRMQSQAIPVTTLPSTTSTVPASTQRIETVQQIVKVEQEAIVQHVQKHEQVEKKEAVVKSPIVEKAEPVVVQEIQKREPVVQEIVKNEAVKTEFVAQKRQEPVQLVQKKETVVQKSEPVVQEIYKPIVQELSKIEPGKAIVQKHQQIVQHVQKHEPVVQVVEKKESVQKVVKIEPIKSHVVEKHEQVVQHVQKHESVVQQRQEERNDVPLIGDDFEPVELSKNPEFIGQQQIHGQVREGLFEEFQPTTVDSFVRSYDVPY